MSFDDVLKDIEGLIGLRLESIRPGAEIVVREVSSDEGRIELETAKGDVKSRPISELRRIWEALSNGTPVHIERVLGGSGSSRNQPETIFANLPYIEWMRHNGKKHIVNVGRNSHPPGTLKKKWMTSKPNT